MSNALGRYICFCLSLMLLLRAFYARFGNMRDDNSVSTRENIERCIWKTDEFGKPNKTALKIDSEVATDNDKNEFLEMFPGYFSYLPTRILNNCILLPGIHYLKEIRSTFHRKLFPDI